MHTYVARKRGQDSTKEVGKEVKTEEAKRRRGRVYGRQEEEEVKGDEEETDKEKGILHCFHELTFD